MSLKQSSFKKYLMILGLLFSVALLIGCDGDDGADGMDGQDGVDGVDGEDGQDYNPLSAVEPESCIVCHADAGQEGHQ